MKIIKGFVSQKICDKTVLVRTGTAKDGFCGIIELNDTAADIWCWLSKGHTKEKTAELLTEKYDVNYDHAIKSVIELSEKMIAAGVVEEY